MNPPEPGWYRDPYFKNRERYWDGEIWTDECRVIQPALPSGQRDSPVAAGAQSGAEQTGRHAVRVDPVTAQQPAVTQDPITTQQPAARSTPSPADTQPIRISSSTVAGAGVGAFFGANGPAARGMPGGPVAGRPAAASTESSAETKATPVVGTTGVGATGAGATGAAGTETEQQTETDKTSGPPTKAEEAANAERVRSIGAAAHPRG